MPRKSGHLSAGKPCDIFSFYGSLGTDDCTQTNKRPHSTYTTHKHWQSAVWVWRKCKETDISGKIFDYILHRINYFHYLARLPIHVEKIRGVNMRLRRSHETFTHLYHTGSIRLRSDDSYDHPILYVDIQQETTRGPDNASRLARFGRTRFQNTGLYTDRISCT